MTDPATHRAAAVRKAEQRARDKAAGLAEIRVIVPADRAEDIRALAQEMRVFALENNDRPALDVLQLAEEYAARLNKIIAFLRSRDFTLTQNQALEILRRVKSAEIAAYTLGGVAQNCPGRITPPPPAGED